jgi:hypothetical protein
MIVPLVILLSAAPALAEEPRNREETEEINQLTLYFTFLTFLLEMSSVRTRKAHLHWRTSAGGPTDIRVAVRRITNGPMIFPSGDDGPSDLPADVRRTTSRYLRECPPV